MLFPRDADVCVREWRYDDDEDGLLYGRVPVVRVLSKMGIRDESVFSSSGEDGRVAMSNMVSSVLVYVHWFAAIAYCVCAEVVHALSYVSSPALVV